MRIPLMLVALIFSGCDGCGGSISHLSDTDLRDVAEQDASDSGEEDDTAVADSETDTSADATEEPALEPGDCTEDSQCPDGYLCDTGRDSCAFACVIEGCPDDLLCDPDTGECLPEPNRDRDGDGFDSGEDCDDENDTVFPDADERCDGLDNDCDSTFDEGGACGECELVAGEDAARYLFCRDMLSWEAARDRCASMGYELVKIEDESEDTFLRVESERIEEGWYWIGLSDLETEGDWVWTDGSPMAYDNFIPPQPDDYEGREDCGHLGFMGGWNDNPCGSAQRYICQLP